MEKEIELEVTQDRIDNMPIKMLADMRFVEGMEDVIGYFAINGSGEYVVERDEKNQLIWNKWDDMLEELDLNVADFKKLSDMIKEEIGELVPKQKKRRSTRRTSRR